MRFGGRGGNILCGSLAQVCKVGSLRHLCSLSRNDWERMICPETPSRPQRQRATSSACKVPHTADRTTHLLYPPPHPLPPKIQPHPPDVSKPAPPFQFPRRFQKRRGKNQLLPSSVYLRTHSIRTTHLIFTTHIPQHTSSAHHSHENYHPSSHGSNNPAYNHPTHNRNSHPSTPPRRTARHLSNAAHNPYHSPKYPD